jgi:hypothetical protein
VILLLLWHMANLTTKQNKPYSFELSIKCAHGGAHLIISNLLYTGSSIIISINSIHQADGQ